MGVTVGEVNAVLTAKDEMSAAFDKAAASSDKLGETINKNSEKAGSFDEAITKVGERLVEVFAAEKIAEFTKGLFESAHALELLSLQTGVSTEHLQVLGAATEEYGISSERLGMIIFQLSRRIAGGDANAVDALHMMGMTLNEVKALGPEELFLRVVNGVGQLQGSAKDLAATELFGGRLGKSIIAFSSDAEGAMKRVKDSISIASDESVKKLAEYEVAINRAWTSFKNFSTQAVGEGIKAIEQTGEAVKAGASKWELFKGFMMDAFLAIANNGIPVTGQFDKVLQEHITVKGRDIELTKQMTEAEKAAADSVKLQTDARRFMNALILDQGKPILAWQEDYLKQLKMMGELNAKTAEAIGVNSQQLKAWEEATKRATEAAKEIANAWLKDAEAIGALAKQEISEQGKKLDELEKREIASLDRRHAAGKMSETQYQDDLFQIRRKYEQQHESLINEQAQHEVEALNMKEEKEKEALQRRFNNREISEETLQEELYALDEEYAAKRSQVNEKADFENADKRQQIWNDYYDALEKKQTEAANHGIAEANRQAQSEKSITSSVQYDLSTIQGVENYRKANPGNRVNWSDDQIVNYIKQGHTLADIITAGGIVMYGNMGNLSGGMPSFDRGSGGVQDFGGGTLAVLHGREAVVPEGSGASGGLGPTYITMFVNGTAEDVARQIEDSLMRRLKQVRQFGAA